MIEESGRVIALEGERAWVEAERKSACGSCSARAGCGTSVLGKVLGRRAMRLEVKNTLDAKVGDQVILGLRDDALVRGSLAVYMVPLIALIGGALMGEWLAGLTSAGDGLSVLGGLGGLGLGFWWVTRFSRRIRHDERYVAVMLRRRDEPARVELLSPAGKT